MPKKQKQKREQKRRSVNKKPVPAYTPPRTVNELRQKIRETQSDTPPMLPVFDEKFAKVSDAALILKTYTRSDRRPIALPSTMLPPL